ncbi:1-(5-phosphoribosyl)-5-[(5-phosphoribosylamino)methylideneamino]imidazole-4-carboxamide isomerase [Salinicoccus roseus]|uniref:1-(5-phosphoribosyl)-5-[(5-phosphoribosylamino)methylideneamino] imidazole-4-carboxamide isomerase n=1 Tax=Salinicoccus roseus TaxID=45670 RepID=A0A0C2E511_9STAP|nr:MULTISPECIES: 1-(5-phosphoribosyl)-5-[(5-phosphoribosylamino)methylideneamino]imidazole-4-carboxamide isomerase [Salinicoccus]KIH70402.1 1-(5-phosphoribosyl)-5-[(5-phosphoribosylamino)methylideneamino] imidazole-4-carboxamide isomerase [Salinicoccus roseus]MCC4722786.1 1-(5-phosphoribosyl)-5-[(5-phosphoribosylamino)methylideneamino]imidazole-4-carboxamide isomerase [Salinicoccus sp. RF5]MDB0580949.1 1-(5-phosphoribosyl)-5-[(5-phosphoribosylamino)methylideneamino]imidazole-4-carboxamide isomer
MNIIPAIDIIEGQNVRLTQGDYGKKTAMKRTPEEAIAFYSSFEQVARIHIVDLMGALKQGAQETTVIQKLKEKTDLPLQIGGGLRETETIEQYDAIGIDYFILGTRAIMDLDWLETVVSRFPGRIFVGVDARENDIYVNGWTENSGITIDDYLKKIELLDIAGIIYTDINKDGMNQGPNFENTQRINGLTRHAVIASGGVRSKDDLDRLETMGITQAIVGKASHSDEFWRDIR